MFENRLKCVSERLQDRECNTHTSSTRKGIAVSTGSKFVKSQSAMEYLMTYGWAILIIAVVLAALFELGVFNPLTFAPKASPGSCQVVRPEGAGTTNFISLAGECNGEIPQYVASFNGQNSYIEQQNGFAFMNNAAQPFSISIWVDPASSNGVIVDELGQLTPNTGWHDSWVELVNGNVYIRVWSLSCVSLGAIPLKQWSNIVMTGSVSGSTITYSGYINGLFRNSGSGSRSVPGGTALMYYPLGTADSTNCGSGAYFSGSMSNYQIYNTSLSANEIQYLYTEGIGGAPIKIQNLVAWYPLNGNTNDYSGNGYNGTAIGVTYNTNWYSGYSTP
ncbi:MAG: LamG-like jellyroll fold domain-containing protein [Candidatus Micrarchaeaceae archaeon]